MVLSQGASEDKCLGKKTSRMAKMSDLGRILVARRSSYRFNKLTGRSGAGMNG